MILNCKYTTLWYHNYDYYVGIEVDLATPRLFSAINHEDLHLVVTHIKAKYPDYQLVTIGVSLGGIKLGKFFCQFGYR